MSKLKMSASIFAVITIIVILQLLVNFLHYRTTLGSYQELQSQSYSKLAKDFDRLLKIIPKIYKPAPIDSVLKYENDLSDSSWTNTKFKVIPFGRQQAGPFFFYLDSLMQIQKIEHQDFRKMRVNDFEQWKEQRDEFYELRQFGMIDHIEYYSGFHSLNRMILV
jgi:hypothetical protein